MCLLPLVVFRCLCCVCCVVRLRKVEGSARNLPSIEEMTENSAIVSRVDSAEHFKQHNKSNEHIFIFKEFHNLFTHTAHWVQINNGRFLIEK